MSRKKKKLRFYNKNPEADYQARAMQKLIELTMPKKEVKELLLEASIILDKMKKDINKRL